MRFLNVEVGRGLDLLDELQRDLVREVELPAEHGGDPAGILRYDLDAEFFEFFRS